MHVFEGNSPAEVFFHKFNIRLAEMSELTDVFKLRYRIYCQQLGYFADRTMTDEESDEFDNDAIHCIVEHKQTRRVVGCVRLVYPNAEKKLPFSDLLPEVKVAPNDCEISRLVVCPSFRNQVDGENIPALIFKALFLSLNVIAERMQLHSGFILIEKRMARALGHLGFTLKACGQQADVKRAQNKITQRHLYSIELLKPDHKHHIRANRFIDHIRMALYGA
ncbi:GNAT family N-acyltransferase [Catenovulum sediminis]|uniref:GNAT family N-acyltransferase n=1 Tax=Catenovulum sediminis TaxID=1740262 RepID=A0ABV1RDD4_9ALTE|nr:GNAT family N-acyltransferase [Catenovulum sediminis]